MAILARSSLLLIGFWLALFQTAWGATPSKLAGKHDSKQPIQVTSNSLQADGTANKVRFIGNVEVRQGNVTISAPEMVLFLRDEGRDIERIEAPAGVRLVQEDRMATGKKGVYFAKEEKIVLSGDAHVQRGEDSLDGDEITVFLNSNRSVVTSRKGSRVKAVFHPKGER